ncbi:SDR family oxidoreductase [Rhodococcus tukisamuensis]|uniref:SDR family oxidoreductase n=1 Tax=Rhodococcus tukisamuensis TaxID=168276 RepID=UPI000932360C|nr:SDR family oxidoreductase [Rhodococcus tukisamuensis]
MGGVLPLIWSCPLIESFPLIKSRVRMKSTRPNSATPKSITAAVVGLMRYYAITLAEKNIRVNTVHPAGVATPMTLNPQFGQFFDEHPEDLAGLQNPLPVPLLEPVDISEALICLCGRTGRYITGVTLPVDAGYTLE